MPKAFLDCVKRGGKVWTEKIDSKRYRHFCKIDGKVYAGEIKTKKS